MRNKGLVVVYRYLISVGRLSFLLYNGWKSDCFRSVSLALHDLLKYLMAYYSLIFDISC